MSLSSSKQQSTYPQSRLSLVSASCSENAGRNTSGITRTAVSATTIQSNHISGLSVLNSGSHKKPLRIERIDPHTKSLKWASSVSDDTENMKMCNNDFISKNKDEVAKKKDVAKGRI